MSTFRRYWRKEKGLLETAFLALLLPFFLLGAALSVYWTTGSHERPYGTSASPLDF